MEPPAKKIKTETPAGISEEDVGIVSYVYPEIPGFSGTLKQRYTDFLVNEIDQEGNVVYLTDLGVEDKQERRREKREKEREQLVVPELGEFKEPLAKLVGEEFIQQCIELFSTGTKIQTEKSFNDKEERTQIHQLFRQAFKGRLETSTTKENQLVVCLQTQSTRSKVPKSAAGEVLNYLQFAVYKENKETMEAASLLARFLRIQPRSISFAGTKDRRGVTTQRFSIRHMNLARVSGLNSTLRGMRLGSFKYTDNGLRLGDLNGNRFFITLRDVSHADNVEAALTGLKESGFINYFGLQRFGTFSISTHTIGKHILSEDFDAAVDCLLRPQELTLPESREAREVWKQTGDAAAALKLMPRKCLAEVQILTALQSSPSAINALLRIPHNLKVMYVHAYQSYVWNRAASERIRKGLEIQPEDLVVSETEGEFVRARPVTQEEIENKTKTIFDVVLPTPGFDVVYPQNLVSFYETIMSEDGIDCHKMRRNIREFSLSGSYRNIMAKPGNIEWWTRDYSEEDQQLVNTDYDLLTAEGGPIDPTDSAKRIHPTEGGDRKAVILQMDLGTSQYATMALREVLKSDSARREMYFN